MLVLLAGCGAAEKGAEAPPPEYRDEVTAEREAGPETGADPNSMGVHGERPNEAAAGTEPDEAPMVIEPPPEKRPQYLSAPPTVRSPPMPDAAEAPRPRPSLELPDAPEMAMPDEEAERAVEYALSADEEPDERFHRVRVFYATDRLPSSETVGLWRYWPAGLAGLVTLLCGAGAFMFSRRALLIVLALGGATATVGLWYSAHIEAQKAERLVREGGQIYGSQRHETPDGYVLEVGVCEVTIPPDHRTGRLEAPSVLRLEFKEDPDEHVMLQRITRLEDDEFYDQLRDCIAQSTAQQAMVFVHGYNVGFDDAVNRTAQIAFDLHFDGAPICYSWPSHGGLAEYTRDENNVTWTVVHLEKFLARVVDETGARTVHLIAHSMGNRALLQALERMDLDRKPEQPLFGQVILAAPDVDTSEFRERFAPAVTSLARQVTLYASTNDQALVASTKVHGYTRAGLSGEHLVVTDGVDTIDVSPIDTSLIGHSYYGNNPLMIRDMEALIELAKPAPAREWLEQLLRPPNVAWWVFRKDFEEDGQDLEKEL